MKEYTNSGDSTVDQCMASSGGCRKPSAFIHLGQGLCLEHASARFPKAEWACLNCEYVGTAASAMAHLAVCL